MATSCTICTHEQQKEIDHDLIGGAAVRDVAGRYGVSKSAVDRHRRHCLAPRVANAVARHEELSQERLAAYAYGLLNAAAWGMVKAQQEEDGFAHRAYLSESRKCVETLARLGGIGRADVQVNVDAREQTLALVAGLSEAELRALAAPVLAGHELPPATVAHVAA